MEILKLTKTIYGLTTSFILGTFINIEPILAPLLSILEVVISTTTAEFPVEPDKQ